MTERRGGERQKRVGEKKEGRGRERERERERVREEEKGNFRKLKASPRCHFSTSEQVADNRHGN